MEPGKEDKLFAHTRVSPDQVSTVPIWLKDGQIIGGPVEAIKKNVEKFVIVVPGKLKKSDMAKRIKHKIGGDLDEIIKFLPSGGCEIK